MASTAWLTAGTITTTGANTFPQLDAWDNPSNASTVNSTPSIHAVGATYTPDPTTYPFAPISSTLQLRNFNASIPSGATVDGIEVSIHRTSLDDFGSGGTAYDYTVRLVVGGTPSGANKADTGTAWPVNDGLSYTEKLYGGATDKWSLTPTDTQVNGSTFGIDFQCRDNGVSDFFLSVIQANVDAIRIKIYYTESGGGGTTVTAESGSLTLVGGDASITTGESVTLESGSLTLTGSEAVITSSDTVVADTGTLALAGFDAVIAENENISLESGTLTLTGNDATITEQTASDVVAESGTLALTGSEAVIITSDSVPAESGSLALTGSNAVIDEGITVVAESGSIGLTGNNALITEAQSVIASTGTLTLNGNNAVINEGVTASSGALTLTGSNAVIEIDASVTVIADSGTLTLAGNQAVIIEGKQVIADTGVLTLVGSNAVINEEVTASSGVLILVGGNAVIISNDNVPASSGSLTLVGSDVFIGTTLPPIDGGIPSFIPFSEILRQRVELIPMRNQILLDNVEMARLRTYTGVWKKLQNICDYQMNDEPQAVVRFDPDAVYSTVTGVNPVKDRFYLDADKAYRHGLCYQITGETRYAVKAQQIIDDWAFKLREINGSVPQGYINFRIAHYIMAGAWVRNVEGWDGNLFETFLLRIEHLSRWERFNNVGAWGILFNICIASYQNDPSKLALWSERLQAQILEQVSSNGVMTEEVTRGGGKQGIAYSNFGMLPWAMAGEVLAKEGYTIFGTPAGDRLGLAYYQLMEWILNPRQFPYYTGDVTLMDSPWQVTYVYIMRKYYSNDNADRVIAMKEHQVPNSFMLDFLFGFQWNPTSEIEKYG